MLVYIKGKIREVNDGSLVIENAGLGYEVFCPPAVLFSLKTGVETELFLYQQIREDANILYGFASGADKKLFELLLTVSGVGPKTALGVFAEATARDIYSAIAAEDATMLKRFSGIGGKTAERIVLELKTKITHLALPEIIKSKQELSADADALEALTSLGFSPADARDALKRLPAEWPIEERVKVALQSLRP